MANCRYLFTNIVFIIFSTFLESSHCQNSVTINREETADAKESILCRLCGTDTGYSNHITNLLSPNALISTNNTLFGKSDVYIQVLTNALDIRFQLITLSHAYCVATSLKWHTEYTWYPGYAWKSCVCRHCGVHIGWMFEPIESATDIQLTPSSAGFYALIVDKILGETFANSLIVTPKFYGH